MARRTRDPDTQRKALVLLAKGYSPAEIAEHAGVSRQLVNQWARSALIDWRRIRHHDLAKAWRNADKVQRRPPTKREQRRLAERAKQLWDKARAGS